MRSGAFNRRSVVAGALALAACDRPARSAPADIGFVPPLKTAAPFPVGTCLQVAHLDQPDWVNLALTQCSQLTPEWEMKMEYIVQPDGGLLFDRPDRIAGFARANGMRLYGTTLVWYAQKPKAFEQMAADPASFGKAYDSYITSVAGRYRGQVAGWDVVNEAVAEDGNGWRDSLWSQRLGAFDHMKRAFHVARAADPDAVLFLNDYNLEIIPKKLDTFQRLVERLLAAGAPVGGLGCQTHMPADLAAGSLAKAVAALGRFGLPVHVSELDVSLSRARQRFARRADLEAGQARLYAEAAQALGALPARQRFALTLWGLRDRDSWLKGENAADMPAVFDDQGRPKPAAAALAAALQEVRG
ncbi:endo-1,4-beta-xylanase [Phenylobacterium sp.]|uniref:endo-1,4-beta-xylanase n=1 Tax=Phenylobacterium sp. TaxID=1871053 RepID=UPI002F40425E